MTTISKDLKQNVEKALDEIRPFLKNDGGDISLIEIDESKSINVHRVVASNNPIHPKDRKKTKRLFKKASILLFKEIFWKVIMPICAKMQ